MEEDDEETDQDEYDGRDRVGTKINKRIKFV